VAREFGTSGASLHRSALVKSPGTPDGRFTEFIMPFSEWAIPRYLSRMELEAAPIDPAQALWAH
jgi:hypothetical protein